jgi:signal transduction histidine kinase
MEGISLSPEMETACFRIAQEALTNIVRHARARHVDVVLSGANGELKLLIKDDGIGFDMIQVQERTSTGNCLGLVGMRERASLIGGRIEIESFPHSGTEVRALFPIVRPRLAVL